MGSLKTYHIHTFFEYVPGWRAHMPLIPRKCIRITMIFIVSIIYCHYYYIFEDIVYARMLLTVSPATLSGRDVVKPNIFHI